MPLKGNKQVNQEYETLYKITHLPIQKVNVILKNCVHYAK